MIRTVEVPREVARDGALLLSRERFQSDQTPYFECCGWCQNPCHTTLKPWLQPSIVCWDLQGELSHSRFSQLRNGFRNPQYHYNLRPCENPGIRVCGRVRRWARCGQGPPRRSLGKKGNGGSGSKPRYVGQFWCGESGGGGGRWVVTRSQVLYLGSSCPIRCRPETVADGQDLDPFPIHQCGTWGSVGVPFLLLGW